MTVTFIGHGIIWDADARRVLGEFENGEYATSNEREIEMCRRNGFPEKEPGAPTPLMKVTVEERATPSSVAEEKKDIPKTKKGAKNGRT